MIAWKTLDFEVLIKHFCSTSAPCRFGVGTEEEAFSLPGLDEGRPISDSLEAASGALSYLESPQFPVSCGVEDNVPKLHGRAGGPARRRMRPRALSGRGCRRRHGCRRGLG